MPATTKQQRPNVVAGSRPAWPYPCPKPKVGKAWGQGEIWSLGSRVYETKQLKSMHVLLAWEYES